MEELTIQELQSLISDAQQAIQKKEQKLLKQLKKDPKIAELKKLANELVAYEKQKVPKVTVKCEMTLEYWIDYVTSIEPKVGLNFDLFDDGKIYDIIVKQISKNNEVIKLIKEFKNKFCILEKESESLAKQYNIDIGMIQRLIKYWW